MLTRRDDDWEKSQEPAARPGGHSTSGLSTSWKQQQRCGARGTGWAIKDSNFARLRRVVSRRQLLDVKFRFILPLKKQRRPEAHGSSEHVVYAEEGSKGSGAITTISESERATKFAPQVKCGVGGKEADEAKVRKLPHGR